MKRRQSRRSRGRPTKLTPEIQAKILEMLQTGAPITQICAAVGITPRCWYYWKNHAENYETTVQDGQKPNPKHTEYFHFIQAIREARARKAVLITQTIFEAVEKDWRAGAWWLERSFADVWGRKRLEITGRDGGPVRATGLTVALDFTGLESADPNELDWLYGQLLGGGDRER